MNKTPFAKALITGASSGMGKALAHLLAKKKIDLLLTGRDETRLEQVAEELSNLVQVKRFTADLSQPEGRTKVLEQIYEHLPDLVLNNAGIGLYGDVLTYPTTRWMNMFHLDATAAMEISIEAARALVAAKKQGTILNISSIAAWQPVPSMAVYAACKNFILLFSEGFDEELRACGVRVLAACPGVVKTRFQERAALEPGKAQKRVAMMTPEFAAEQIWRQIKQGKTVHIFDWKYRLLCFFSHYIAPRWLTYWTIRRTFSGKLPRRDPLPPKKEGQ